MCTISFKERFKKGRVSCSFASASNRYTIGFVDTGRPMTLMKNNQLDEEQSKPVIAVLKKNRTDRTFTDVVMGDITAYEELINAINQI